MAHEGWILTWRHGRLSRLAGAQREVADLLDVKLAREQNAVLLQEALIGQLSSAMSGTTAGLLIFHDAGLRRLVEAEAALERSRAEVMSLRQKLIAARSRERSLSSRAAALQRHVERKRTDEDALDAALILAAKACHKDDVVK